METKLPLSTIEQQAEKYRKLIRLISDMASRLNISEYDTEKQLEKIEAKIFMYSKAEKDLIKYIDYNAVEEYPELSSAEAENDFAYDVLSNLEGSSPAPVVSLVENVLDQFYAWRI